MRMHEILTAELGALREKLGRPLTVVETGSVRSTDPLYSDDDGWSTLTLAAAAQHHGDRVTSIDLDTTAAAALLAEHHLDGAVELIRGHSIEVLAGMLAVGRSADAVLLDSDNDPALILHEFMLARWMMRRVGIILVDDVDPGSDTVRKGHLLVPHLTAEGVDFRMQRRAGPRHSTGVLIVERTG